MSNLTEFYIEINDWINLDCPKHPVFNKGNALCYSLDIWTRQKELPRKKIIQSSDELRNQFKESYLHYLHPFNRDMYELENEAVIETLYINYNRLAWIKSHTH